MRDPDGERRVEEVDVERLPEGHDPRTDPWPPAGGPARRSAGPGAAPAAPGATRRAGRAIGPVLAGAVLDGVDLLTFHPVAGLVLGALTGYLLGRGLGLDRRRSLGVAGASALYCAAPFTSPFPIATLVGAYARFVRGV